MKKRNKYGWAGYIAQIDLESLSWNIQSLDRDFYLRFLGGRGMGGHFFAEHSSLEWDAPQMPICIFSGALTGSLCPGSGWASIISRSPLTGGIGEAHIGGRLGIQLKRAGLDGLVIRGKSPYPVGIEIRDHKIYLVRADALWGLSINEVYKTLGSHKSGFACIGPAGENLVRFSSVCGDRYHMAARTGMGAVWGVKHLKYILVSGNRPFKIADPLEFKVARKDILRLVYACPALMGAYGFNSYGTGAVYDLTRNRNMMPTDNFKEKSFDKAEQMNAFSYSKAFPFKENPCPACPVNCRKIFLPASSQNSRWDKAFPIPEFDAMSHFSALIGCKNIRLVADANKLCFDLGMDPVSTASTLACHREITGQDYTETNLLTFIRDIGHCQKKGKQLALGAAIYSKIMGYPGTAMTVKSLEIPAYDPRGALGMALGLAVSTIGACYLRGNTLGHELFRKPVATNPMSFTGKARIVKIAEDLHGVTDSLGICPFLLYAVGLADYSRIFKATTGIDLNAQELLNIGEGIVVRERLINEKNGLTKEDDDLPSRFFSESLSPIIPALDREEFLKTREKYYKLRNKDIT